MGNPPRLKKGTKDGGRGNIVEMAVKVIALVVFCCSDEPKYGSFGDGFRDYGRNSRGGEVKGIVYNSTTSTSNNMARWEDGNDDRHKERHRREESLIIGHTWSTCAGGRCARRTRW
eukprot:Gb_08339 [translate_table: standard]